MSFDIFFLLMIYLSFVLMTHHFFECCDLKATTLLFFAFLFWEKSSLLVKAHSQWIIFFSPSVLNTNAVHFIKWQYTLLFSTLSEIHLVICLWMTKWCQCIYPSAFLLNCRSMQGIWCIPCIISAVLNTSENGLYQKL